MVPERIGPYRVIRRCGAGGMGEVYLAQDTRLERSVALKFLPEEFTRDAVRRQRFFSEARAAAALAHPHICTVYDVAETEDARPYIAMEWLEGPTLRERLTGAPLPLDELLEVGLRVAEALEAAHARGIVHRDVKPGNVSLTAGGLVKVLDFGLAKWLQPQLSTEGDSRTTVFQTESGQIMGTPAYMSPEQATGKPVDQRTDLFSLGVMLYEMATGRVPFGGSNWAEILRGIVERQPEPMVRFNGEVPTELERIVMKCLQKAPGERYQSASELRIDLAALQASLAAPRSAASGQVVTLLCLEVPEALRLKESGRLQASAELIRQEQGKLQKLLSGPEGRVETVGDSLLARFGRPSEAVQVALRMVSESGVACRLGLHLGEVIEPGQAEPLRRYGVHLEMGVRLMQLAEPGHILMTRGVFDSARAVVKREEVAGLGALSWVSHGPYEFAGMEEPLEVCEVGICGRAVLSAPPTTEKAKRQVRPDEEPVLGWRPAVGQEVPNTQWILEEKLGEGGFGEVWKARHETLKEQHVFKFCFRADRVRSLKREVTLFRLMKERVGEHANVVRLYDVYFDQPPFYLEEEYVPGKDLKSWCEAQGGIDKVPLEIRLELVAQAAEALQAAHDAGVIHRDVKPGNILVGGQKSEVGGQKSNTGAQPPALNPQPLAKLTDFGIGQVISEEFLKNVTRAGFTQTLAGSDSSSHTGTQLYMAPEVLSGKPASTRSDIYSLGVVLYQLLVCDFTRPVTTDWAAEISDPLLRQDLQHCFAGHPEHRFAGAALLARNLRALPERRAAQAEEERTTHQAARRRFVFRLAVGVAAGLSILAGALLYGLRRAQAETLKARRIAYASDMNVAWAALRDNNLDQVKYLLDAQIPERGQQDLRHWEWRYLWQQCRGEQLWTLGPIGGVAYGLAVLPNDRLAIGGGGAGPGGRVYIWDLKRQETLRASNFTGNISSLAASADGRRLAIATWGPTVRLLDPETLEVVGEIRHTKPIWRIAISPTGDLLSARGYEDLSVWDLATLKRLWAIEMPDSLCEAPFFPDGESLAVPGFPPYGFSRVGARDGNLIWKHDANANACIAASTDGRLLACGSWNGPLTLIQEPTGQSRELTNYNQPISAVEFSHDAHRLAVSGSDRVVRLWDLETTKETCSFRGHRKQVCKMAFSPDDRQLFTASQDGTVRGWDIQMQPVLVADPSGSWANWGQDDVGQFGARPITRDARVMATRATNSIQRIVSLESFREIGSAQLPTNSRPLAVSLDGYYAAAGSSDGTIAVWDVAAGKLSWNFTAHSNPIDALEFAPRGDRLATAARGGEVRLWKHGESKPEFSRVLGSPGDPVYDMAFTPNEKTLVVSGYGCIHLPSLEPGGGDRKISSAEMGNMYCIDVSRDGSRVAAGGGGLVSVWNLRSLRLVATLRGSLGLFTGTVSLSPDGGRVIASDNLRVSWLWDLATGREVGRFGPSQLGYAHFQPDGNTIVISRFAAPNPLRVRTWAGLAFLRAPTFAEISETEKADAAARQRWMRENGTTR